MISKAKRPEIDPGRNDEVTLHGSPYVPDCGERPRG
jgi:hypothetical protein